MFDKENPTLSAKEALSLLRAPLAPEGQPDSPSTLQAHEDAMAKRFAHTPVLPSRTPLTPKSPNPASGYARTPVTPQAARFERGSTEDFDLSFNSTGAGSTPGTALSVKSGGASSNSVTRRIVAESANGRLVVRRPSPVLETSPTHIHAKLGREDKFGISFPKTDARFSYGDRFDEAGGSTGGAFSPTVKNAVNAAAIVEAAAACTPGNFKTHPTPVNTPMGYVHPPAVSGGAGADQVFSPVQTCSREGSNTTPTQEQVIEEVRSWFQAVHSKLDVALHVISPGKETMSTAVGDSTEETTLGTTEEETDNSMSTPTAAHKTPSRNTRVFPVSAHAYPTPVCASDAQLQDEARRAAAELTRGVIARLSTNDSVAVTGAAEETPAEESAMACDAKAEAEEEPVPEETTETLVAVAYPLAIVKVGPVMTIDAPDEQVVTAYRKEVVTAASPQTPAKSVSLRAPLWSPPVSSPQVGHTASDALQMTDETLRVVTMVTCAALLSGYSAAMVVFSVATIFNLVAAVIGWTHTAVLGLGAAPVVLADTRGPVAHMHGAYMLYPPQLADVVFSLERTIGSVLGRFTGDALDVGLETLEETLTVIKSTPRVTVTLEGLGLLFLVIVSAILAGGVFVAAGSGTETVRKNTKEMLTKVVNFYKPGVDNLFAAAMDAMSPVRAPRRF